MMTLQPRTEWTESRMSLRRHVLAIDFPDMNKHEGRFERGPSECVSKPIELTTMEVECHLRKQSEGRGDRRDRPSSRGALIAAGSSHTHTLPLHDSISI